MTSLSQPQGPGIARNARPGQILVIVCAGVVMASLDLFIVNVALPQIAADLHEPDLGALSWVLNGYAIVYAALLVLAGRLADQRNRKAGFLIGVAVFTAGSAACGAAASVPMLIAFRLVQAAGAALLTPTSLGLVLASYPAERRGSAVRAWTAAGGMAAALGPVVGGLLVAASWRWVFLVNVPIGLAALMIGWRKLPDVAGHPGPRPDELSALLVTAGVGGLTWGLVRGGDWGWGSGRTIAVLAAAVVLVGLFALRCAWHRNPLIEPALFRVRTFSGASLATLLFSVSFGAMLLSIVLWMQDAWGWSALRTGVGVAPGPLMVPLFSFLVTGRLLARYGPAIVIGAGAAVFAAGVSSWAAAVQLTPNYLEILPGMHDHRDWRRTDFAIADVNCGLVAPRRRPLPPALVSSTCSGAGRYRRRRRDAGRRARQRARICSRADGVPAWLVRHCGSGCRRSAGRDCLAPWLSHAASSGRI